MNLENNLSQNEKIEMEYGDFFIRCFPKTHEYFKKNHFKKYNKENIDCFDLFIKNEVPFFSFLVDQYYKNKRRTNLQLVSLADEKILDHFDQFILEYLQTSNKDIYDKVRELYIYFLETCLLKYCLNKK